MKRKILAKTHDDGQTVAVIEDGVLVEYVNQLNNDKVRGTVLVGVVKDYRPSLNAYFIDVGTDINGFLPSKFTEKVIKTGAQIVLQVVKPAFRNKGMTLSSALSISGKFCVISTNSGEIRVSSKIESKSENDRLTGFAKTILPFGYGIVFRTNSYSIDESILAADIEDTLILLKEIIAGHGQTGKILYRPEGIIEQYMRNFNEKDDMVYFNDMNTFNKYFGKYSKRGSVPVVKYYNKNYDMFDFFGISNKIKTASGKKVWLKSGGTLIFEYTEAMCVIDVNSAKNTKSVDFESTAYITNKEAAVEIAVQIRLRNISGIIIIDFIDMSKYKNDELDVLFRKQLALDDRKMTIGGFTKLGNYEITRTRKGRRLEFFDE